MTQSSTNYGRGDIIVVPFGFCERSVFKRRPALVLSSGAYNSHRDDIVIAPLTTRIRQPLLFGDYEVQARQEIGLPGAVSGYGDSENDQAASWCSAVWVRGRDSH
jgi:mRNA-degrading endonuclease toxin of MazEF toxin-antitoxin module